MPCVGQTCGCQEKNVPLRQSRFDTINSMRRKRLSPGPPCTPQQRLNAVADVEHQFHQAVGDMSAQLEHSAAGHGVSPKTASFFQ